MPFSRVEVVPRTGSTNTDLVAALRAEPAAWPHLSVLRAEHQAAGKGRAGREWTTPPGTALTASIVLRPSVDPSRWPILTLLGGLAVVRALHELTAPAALKWPNDVVLPAEPAIDGWGALRKVGGVLAEAVPDEGAVVLGVGVNVSQAAAELPVPWATSLALAGIETTPERLLEAIGRELAAVLARWADVPQALLHDLRGATATLGRAVAVDLPGGRVLEGRAADLDAQGRLVLEVAGATRVVDAGDVRHLRLA